MIRIYNAEIALDMVEYLGHPAILTGDVMLDTSDGTVYVKVISVTFHNAFVPAASVTPVDLDAVLK